MERFFCGAFFYGSCLEKVNGLKKGGGGGRVDCVGGLN